MWICIPQKFKTCICGTQKMKMWICIPQKFTTCLCATQKFENVKICISQIFKTCMCGTQKNENVNFYASKFKTCICAIKKWKCEFLFLKGLIRAFVLLQKLKIWIYIITFRNLKHAFFLPKNENVNFYLSKILNVHLCLQKTWKYEFISL